MHICHVNLAGGFSGGERQTLNLITHLAGKGVEQTLVVRPGNPLIEATAELSVTLRTSPHFLLGHGRAGHWDLIHCHDGKGVYWGLIEHLLRQTPYVITRRVDNPLGTGFLTRQAYTRAARVACLSSAIRQVVLESIPTAKTAIIPSSFSGFDADADAVKRIREQYAGRVLVGQVGRFLHHKGHAVTVQAARRLAVDAPEVLFLFLGEGPEEESLREQARDLDNVVFTGFQKDIGNWLAALDVLVFPSLKEGLGSTILEALQHGVPVVGARAGGIPDIIRHDENGLLVAPGDAEALAQATLALLRDKALRQRLVSNATDGLAAFSPQSTANTYVQLYRDILR